MRLINTLFLTIIVTIMVLYPCVNAFSATGSGEEQAYYARVVESIIVKCEKKISLKDSRSANLCRCAEIAERKAKFIKDHKDQLIEGMMAEGLPLKTYKVERYINARFTHQNQSKP